MLPKSERFEMRLDGRLLQRVDNWRSEEDGIPSRSEAIRRLIEIALEATSPTNVKLTDGNKLIAVMLCDILKHLKIEGDVDPEFVKSALSGGHDWALKWDYPGIFHNADDKETTVMEVVNILDMYTFIERGFDELTEAEKTRVGLETKSTLVRFPGFDGNNESRHYSLARFIVDKMKRFSNFAERDLNSHARHLNSYRRMLAVFEPFRSGLMGRELTAKQLTEILHASLPPVFE